MNRATILFHLKEAKEELDRTIAEIEKNRAVRAATFLVNMSHLYHHLNTAWNARKVPTKRHCYCSMTDYYKWEKFPKHSELLLGRMSANAILHVFKKCRA
jgi:hypothetical protein